MGQSMVDWFEVEGYRTVWLRSGRDALATLAGIGADIVVCDIRLPDMTGEDIHASLAGVLVATPFLFITGHGDIAQAVRLMKAGAADYVTKPFEIDDVLARIEALLGTRWRLTDGFVLGRAPAIIAAERILRRVAPLESTVLLTGPSGSGKEVAARLLHGEGPRRARPFVAINCAAMPEHLVESALFGHERGAFTGATQRHSGFAEQAEDGTLFLDEVADLPSALQPKLLRLLQERVFQRVGGDRLLPFRSRIVAATNADPKARIVAGTFREDLFFRLAVIVVDLPPLKARIDDILPLARRFLGEFAEAFARSCQGFSGQAEAALLAHDFPGNIRELRNRVERAVALADGPWIGPADLFPERMVPMPAIDASGSLADVRDSAERGAIQAALAATQGDVTLAAERLEVSRSTLFDKIRKLRIR